VGCLVINKKNKIVVAPKRWSGKLSIDKSDILPKKWIKISNQIS
jgi:hypothetical protein